MKKLSSARKTSDASRKKEIEKKIKAALRASEKTPSKKKTVKKEKPKSAAKNVTGKSESKTKKGSAKSKGAKEKEPGKGKTEGVKKIKKVSAGVRSSVKVAVKEKDKKGEPEKPAKKSAVQVKKKAVTAKAQKRKTLVSSDKPEKKVRVKLKGASGVAEPKRTIVRAKVRVKPKTKVKEGREKSPAKGAKTPGARKAETPKKEKSASRLKGTTTQKGRTRKKVLSAPEAKFPPLPWETLPAGYGENGINLMTVNPNKLFTFWEVREDILNKHRGDLVIRAYDITGVDLEKEDANSYVDLPAAERIGKEYIHVIPGKEFIADIGIMYSGTFIMIARSGRAASPRAVILSDAGISTPVQGDADSRIGY